MEKICLLSLAAITTVTIIGGSVAREEVAKAQDKNISVRSSTGIPMGIWGGVAWNVDSSGTLILKASTALPAELKDTNHGANVPWTQFASIINKISLQDVIYTSADASCLFAGLNKVTKIENLANLNSTRATNMYRMFADMSSVKNLDVSVLDTSNVTSMEQMFKGTTSLTDISWTWSKLHMTAFKTPKVRNMGGMFDGGDSLTNLDLSTFDTSSLTNMNKMFANMKSLTGINLSKFNTSKVDNMNDLFNGDISLNRLDLSTFDTS